MAEAVVDWSWPRPHVGLVHCRRNSSEAGGEMTKIYYYIYILIITYYYSIYDIRVFLKAKIILPTATIEKANRIERKDVCLCCCVKKNNSRDSLINRISSAWN